MKIRRLHALVGCLAIGATGVGYSPAQAAVASGSAKAGNGGQNCSLTVSCGAFRQTCTMNAANDLDASVRAAAVGGQTRFVNGSYTAVVVTPPQGYIVVQPMDAACQENGLPLRVAPSGGFVSFPPGTAYVAAWPVDKFQSFTWTLH